MFEFESDQALHSKGPFQKIISTPSLDFVRPCTLALNADSSACVDGDGPLLSTPASRYMGDWATDPEQWEILVFPDVAGRGGSRRAIGRVPDGGFGSTLGGPEVRRLVARRLEAVVFQVM